MYKTSVYTLVNGKKKMSLGVQHKGLLAKLSHVRWP